MRRRYERKETESFFKGTRAAAKGDSRRYCRAPTANQLARDLYNGPFDGGRSLGLVCNEVGVESRGGVTEERACHIGLERARG